MNHKPGFMHKITHVDEYQRYYHFVDSHSFMENNHGRRKMVTVKMLVDAGFVLHNSECKCPALNAKVFGCVLHVATDLDILCLDLVVEGEKDWVSVVNDKGLPIEQMCWPEECNYEHWTATRQAMHRLELEEFYE